MAPTILAALDAPATVSHTGRVLHEIVGTDARVTTGAAAAADAGSAAEPTVSDTEADEMEEHLRGLGYLE